MAKILLVDDDQYIREIYDEVLQEAGHEVDIAEDGREGLEKVMKGGYDLVLLDVMLPYLDGMGILEELKTKKPDKPNKKIVLLTNLVNDPVISEAVEIGAAEYINKADMNPDEFMIKVNEILKVKK